MRFGEGQTPGGCCCAYLPLGLHDFHFWMAASTSFAVKQQGRLVSAVAVLESEVTSGDLHRAKYLPASGKRPLFISCEAMEFADTGHVERVVLLHVSLFMVCHALRLECVNV